MGKLRRLKHQSRKQFESSLRRALVRFVAKRYAIPSTPDSEVMFAIGVREQHGPVVWVERHLFEKDYFAVYRFQRTTALYSCISNITRVSFLRKVPVITRMIILRPIIAQDKELAKLFSDLRYERGCLLLEDYAAYKLSKSQDKLIVWLRKNNVLQH